MAVQIQTMDGLESFLGEEKLASLVLSTFNSDAKKLWQVENIVNASEWWGREPIDEAAYRLLRDYYQGYDQNTYLDMESTLYDYVTDYTFYDEWLEARRIFAYDSLELLERNLLEQHSIDFALEDPDEYLDFIENYDVNTYLNIGKILDFKICVDVILTHGYESPDFGTNRCIFDALGHGYDVNEELENNTLAHIAKSWGLSPITPFVVGDSTDEQFFNELAGPGAVIVCAKMPVRELCQLEDKRHEGLGFVTFPEGTTVACHDFNWGYSTSAATLHRPITVEASQIYATVIDNVSNSRGDISVISPGWIKEFHSLAYNLDEEIHPYKLVELSYSPYNNAEQTAFPRAGELKDVLAQAQEQQAHATGAVVNELIPKIEKEI